MRIGPAKTSYLLSNPAKSTNPSKSSGETLQPSPFAVRDRSSSEQADRSDTKDDAARAKIFNLIDRLRRVTQSRENERFETILEEEAAESETTPSPPIAEEQTVSQLMVHGGDSAQIGGSSFSGLRVGEQWRLEGRVVRVAQGATLSLAGDAQATVGERGRYRLTGNEGSVVLEVFTGESLQSLADRINEQRSATGVTATVSSNNLVLSSRNRGRNAAVYWESLDGDTSTIVQGRNAAQVANFEVAAITSDASETLSGSVVSTAQAANLVYRGASGATASGTASFRLTGSRGSMTVAVQQGESLDDVATRINEEMESTGVVASVSGDDLYLSSTSRGAASSVRVDQSTVAFETAISGVNSQQVTDFAVIELADGSRHTLSGEVLNVESKASLTLHGNTDGTVIDTITFEVSGTLGAANFTAVQGESLDDVADRVNLATSTTGVSATRNGSRLVFESIESGSAASASVQLVHVDHTVTVSGVNGQQLTDFQVSQFTDGASQTLSGQVLSTATRASLVLQGSYGGTVLDTVSFEVRGSLGSTVISAVQGESLADVAQRVNLATSTTGVSAAQNGSQLVLQSVEVGSAAEASVQLVHVDHTVTVSGVNAQQLLNFEVDQFTDGASQTLSGSITQAAAKAELQFQGVANRVGTDASITISGSEGSAQYSVTALTTLGSFVAQVNQDTDETGVTARVESGKIKFRSVGTGSDAEVNIHVNSGWFNATGGNGDGTANGTNAVAVVNGQTITAGAGDHFQFTDSKGTYSFTAVAGFTGAFSAVNIASTAGSFQLSGGNGSGTAYGADAVAIVNGQTITGSGNSFQLTDAKGTYAFTSAAGFTGTFSSVNIASTAGSFQVTGGNGDGTANGRDAQAIINGVTITGVRKRFGVSEVGGRFELEFADGFTGRFNTIAVDSTAQAFEMDGADGTGTAYGADGAAIINGTQYASSDDRYAVTGSRGSYVFTFAEGFLGDFDPISVMGGRLGGSLLSAEAFGVAAEAEINGRSFTGTDSQFFIEEHGRSATLTFAADFTGDFGGLTATIVERKIATSAGSTRSNAEQRQRASSTVASVPVEAGFVQILKEIDSLVATTREEERLEDAASSRSSDEVTKSEPEKQTSSAALAKSDWLSVLSQSGLLTKRIGTDLRAIREQTQLRQSLDLLG